MSDDNTQRTLGRIEGLLESWRDQRADGIARLERIEARMLSMGEAFGSRIDALEQKWERAWNGGNNRNGRFPIGRKELGVGGIIAVVVTMVVEAL